MPWKVATAPTACGIETRFPCSSAGEMLKVATAPTACGIETCGGSDYDTDSYVLQQHLPLAVLKPTIKGSIEVGAPQVATAPTACGIETLIATTYYTPNYWDCCNSTYRLRY